MNDFISKHDLPHDVQRLVMVHLPDLVQAIVIACFELFKFLLELLKISSHFLELLSILQVQTLKPDKFIDVVLFDLAHDSLAIVLLVFQDFAHFLANSFALIENFRVEV
jgi:hypothetical protein